jgi:fructose-1,6-bisphosphatase/inositol monophosphatase family enzyme
MPRNTSPKQFLDTVVPVIRQCAQASLIFHGDVVDIGKTADMSLTGQNAQTASAALTVLDGAFQDLILGAVASRFPKLRCIAEEKTAMRQAFAGNTGEEVVILDPIDGTLHFQKGDAPYHISIGLCRKGQMVAAAIARPTQDKLFTAIRGQGAWVQKGKGRPRRLRVPKKPRTKRAFISSKARSFQAPARQLLTPFEYPIGAALVLTQLAEGDLAAYLTRQVETYDVGPPSLIAEEAGVHCMLGDGREPLYDRRKKFAYYMAASTPELCDFLLSVRRQTAGDTS